MAYTVMGRRRKSGITAQGKSSPYPDERASNRDLRGAAKGEAVLGRLGMAWGTYAPISLGKTDVG